jgi:membrane associated rhomboid family serine protease
MSERTSHNAPPRSFVIVALVLANALIAVLLWGQGNEEAAIEGFGHVRSKIWEGEYWRLLTSVFLHAGPVHLGFNLVLLFLIGRVVEYWVGPGGLLWRYLLCALAGALAFQAFSSSGPGVGASGGVVGLLGIFLVGRMGRHGPSGVVLGRRFWFWLSILLAALILEPLFAEELIQQLRKGEGGEIKIATSAHLGGFACGLLLGYIFFTPPSEHALRRAFAILSLTFLTAGIGVYGVFLPFRDWRWFIWQADKAVGRGEAQAAASLQARARELGGDAAALAIVAQLIADSRFDEALCYAQDRPPESRALEVEVLYHIYDALAGGGRVEEARQILDRLIAMVDRELEAQRSAALLNQAAWFRALRGVDLETARAQASEAVQWAATDGAGEFERSAYVNTLGVVELALADYEPALKHLRKAVELAPLGANYLYLALGYFQIGEKPQARKAALRARQGGGLSRHEEKLLHDLEASLAAG